MKWWFLSATLLCLLACRDPYSYQPVDPTKPDPPAPPVLDYPVDGWQSYDYVYPQNVNFGWQAVSGAQFYEMQVTKDSLFQSIYIPLGPHIYQTSAAESMRVCGVYYWRVRAASSRWNDYTDWPDPFWFALPNPAR